ncbi:MAG: hypothetical protein ACK5E4_09390 [Planctomycetia bacterium]
MLKYTPETFAKAIALGGDWVNQPCKNAVCSGVGMNVRNFPCPKVQ